MKKVLIITYYWPPGSGPGVQRFLKFTKYLREFGWEPYILTVRNGAYPSRDESLLKDVPEDVNVYRTKTFEPFGLFNFIKGNKGNTTPMGFINLNKKKSWLNNLMLYIRANYFIPDARKYWKKFALKKARKVILENRIDAIITTGPPQSTHLIGNTLHQKLSIPWIADLTDPWTNVYYNSIFPRTKRTKIKDKKLEDRVATNADCLTVVSAGLKEEFSDRAKDIETIYNGYDESDFKEIEFTIPEKFTLAYIGNLKPNQNVKLLWKCIEELCEEVDGFRSNFKLLLTGNIDGSILDDINGCNINGLTEIRSFLPHQEAVSLMCSVSMLLFVVPQATNNKLIITGKLFEYIASGTPILSVGPVDGDASKLLNEAHRIPMMDYKDKDVLKNCLRESFNQWQKSGSLEKHDTHTISDYSRRGLTKKLSEKLNQITGEHQ